MVLGNENKWYFGYFFQSVSIKQGTPLFLWYYFVYIFGWELYGSIIVVKMVIFWLNGLMESSLIIDDELRNLGYQLSFGL